MCQFLFLTPIEVLYFTFNLVTTTLLMLFFAWQWLARLHTNIKQTFVHYCLNACSQAKFVSNSHKFPIHLYVQILIFLEKETLVCKFKYFFVDLLL